MRRRLARIAWRFLLASLLAGCPAAPVDDGGNDNLPPTGLTVEIGYTDETGLNYQVIPDGGVMPLFTIGQGGSHMFATLRATGFPVDEFGTANINLDEFVTLGPDQRVIHNLSEPVTFFSIADDGVEVQSRRIVFDALPTEVDGQLISVEFTLTSVADPTINARITQTLLMDLP